MAQNKFKISKESYSFEALINEWSCTVEDVFNLVWATRELRVSIPTKKLNEYIHRDIGGRSKKIIDFTDRKWAVYYKNTHKIYDGDFIYLSLSEDQGNEAPDEDGWGKKQDVGPTVIVSPEKSLPSLYSDYEEHDIENDVFVDFSGQPLTLSSYVQDWTDPDSIQSYDPSGRVGIKLHRSNQFCINAEEKSRFEEASVKKNVSHLRDDIKANNMKAGVGLLAQLLASKVSKYKVGNRPNAKVISEDALAWAVKSGISIDGVKTLQEHIREGIKELEGRMPNKK